MDSAMMAALYGVVDRAGPWKKPRPLAVLIATAISVSAYTSGAWSALEVLHLGPVHMLLGRPRRNECAGPAGFIRCSMVQARTKEPICGQSELPFEMDLYAN